MAGITPPLAVAQPPAAMPRVENIVHYPEIHYFTSYHGFISSMSCYLISVVHLGNSLSYSCVAAWIAFSNCN